MDRIERDRMTQQIRRFADQYHFESIIKPSSPDPDDIFFQLWRDNIQLAGTKRPRNGTNDLEFAFAFYRRRQMAMPSMSEIDPLMVALKKMLAEVPGLVVTKEE
jgi:hypothetical protein